MRKIQLTLLIAGLTALPALAGALVLMADNADAIPEAAGRKAVVAVHTTACQSPEKTVVVATAEGLVGGKRVTVPLTVIRLSTPGAYALKRDWPKDGTWALKVVATNPDYKDYATSVLMLADPVTGKPRASKSLTHAPTAGEIDTILKSGTLE